MPSDKTILITNIASPYRIPLYKKLSEKLPDFSVWFLARTESNRHWNEKQELPFSHKFLIGKSFNLIKGHFDSHLNFVFFDLIKEKPSVVITSGYDQIAYWQAFFYCKFFNKKFVLWNGSTLLSSKKLSGLIGGLKKIIIKNSDGYIAYGTKASEYLAKFGADPNKIATGLNTVDIDKFIADSEAFYDSKEYLMLKNKFHYDKIFFNASRMIKYKGIETLLDLADKLKQENKNDFCLILAGEGRDRVYFEKVAKERGLNNVFFLGHVKTDEIYKYYAVSDVFLFPTMLEPWGLVVNEALACGCYVVCSDKAAAGYDLVSSESGELIDFKDKKTSLKVLEEVLKKDFDRGKITQSVKKFNIDYYADKIVEAVGLAG